MIWALLAILGVPIWLIIGVLIGAVIRRRRFRAQGDVFALARREHSKADWSRRPLSGRYVHDVLVVNSGLRLVRTSAQPVDRLEPIPLDGTVRKLIDPQAWSITLESSAGARCGPFGS